MNETDIVHVLKLMSITGLKVAGPILGVVLAVSSGVLLAGRFGPPRRKEASAATNAMAAAAVNTVTRPWWNGSEIS